MKNATSFMRFILMAVVLGSLILTSTTTVSAGSRGQQITIYACNADRIYIYGPNQNNVKTPYTLNKSSSVCGWYNINSMWWEGLVTVTAYYYVSPEYPYYAGQSVVTNVPIKQQNSDWVSVNIPTPTTRQWISWRAQTWVNDHVSYNQGSYHDGYRQDCSGFV